MPNDLTLPPMPTPIDPQLVFILCRDLNFFTALQLDERDRQIVELCAKVCEEQWAIDGTRTAQEFATAIRALIGEQT